MTTSFLGGNRTIPCTACTFTLVVSCLPSPTLFNSDSAALKRRSSPLSGVGLSIVVTRRVAALNAFIDSTFWVRRMISSASELRNHVTDPFAYPALRAASVTFPPFSNRFSRNSSCWGVISRSLLLCFGSRFVTTVCSCLHVRFVQV